MTESPNCIAIIAGAGTGKSTRLLEIALSVPKSQNVLYLTFTENNAHSFSSELRRKNGAFPSNVHVMTWFSFLLTHGVRPFPCNAVPERVSGCYLQTGRPPIRKGVTKGSHDYYCCNHGVVYTTRLSELTLLCNEQWGGAVFDRISRVFPIILVDEAQDFSGRDYEVVAELLRRSKYMVIVGDPRQSTYRTSHEAANSGFTNLFDYLEKKNLCRIDRESLTVSYRCPAEVLKLANRLYPSWPEVRALNSDEADDAAVSFVKMADIEEYARSRDCIALTIDKRVYVPQGIKRLNMGEAKGLTIENVIVYPTSDMKKWLNGKEVTLKPETLAKFYVAITRASQSLAFVL